MSEVCLFLEVLTWPYAEASNNPNDTSHADVAHDVQLCLRLIKLKS